jgi:CrcB protein
MRLKGLASQRPVVPIIAAAGAVGAVARYGLAGWVQGRSGFHFPWGTLAVNILGSVLIGASICAWSEKD